MTWLSFCSRSPGPDWKVGYGTGDRRLSEIEGVVDHSMEGSMNGAYSVLDGPTQSSWTFSLPKFSEPIQHYSLEKITWHAGLPGDRRQDTSLIGNLTLVGKEYEGVAGEPWTENQLYWSAKIDVALRQLCPAFGANTPTLRLNMWEHRWLSATSCPSGRNPWNAKFGLISTWEGDMDEQATKALIQQAINAHEAVPHYSFQQIADNLPALNQHLTNVVNALIAKHANDAAKHSAGEGHDHEIPASRTQEA